MLAGSLTQVSGACDEQREFFEYALLDKIEAIIKNMLAGSKYSVYSS